LDSLAMRLLAGWEANCSLLKSALATAEFQ